MTEINLHHITNALMKYIYCTFILVHVNVCFNKLMLLHLLTEFNIMMILGI